MSTEDSADLFMTLLVQHGHLTDDVYFLVLWRRTQYRYYNACLPIMYYYSYFFIYTCMSQLCVSDVTMSLSDVTLHCCLRRARM